GLKGAKAAQLLAAMEIARRVALPAKRSQLQFTSTATAAAYLGERLRNLADEHFRILYLNRKNALLEDALIAQGTVDSVRPPLRNIIAHALRVNASGMIAAHTHQSGAAEPTESDRLHAWKKGNTPKRGEFSPDFFIKQGDWVFVTEIKGDEEITEPSQETVKKHQYAIEHFNRLNKWLERSDVPARYQFNMVTPKDYGKYFTKLRQNELEGFRSELDVKLTQLEKAD
ncbi:MAG: JAB domain-containing protein, partial [Pirellulales bacterium]